MKITSKNFVSSPDQLANTLKNLFGEKIFDLLSINVFKFCIKKKNVLKCTIVFEMPANKDVSTKRNNGLCETIHFNQLCSDVTL